MRPEHLGAGNSVTMGLLPPSMWPSTLPRARAAATDGSPAGTAAGFYEALAAGAPGRPFAPAGDASQGGGDAVRRILAPLGTGAAGLEVVTHELLEYGSAILALGTWRRRPAGGEPGRSVAYAHVWVFEGVTLRELRQYAAWLPRAEPRREGRAAAGGGP
jgi:hypothetical protein